MKIKPFFLKIIFIILLVIGITFWFFKIESSDSAQYPNTQSKTPESNSVVRINSLVQTTAWREYIDSENSFSFKYPKEFTTDINTVYPGSGDILVTLRGSSYGDWTFAIARPSDQETLDHALKTFPFRDEKDFKETALLINGRKYEQLSYNFNGITYTTIFIPDNKSYIEIDWKSAESISKVKTVLNNKNDLYTLLSTFKFLNK